MALSAHQQVQAKRLLAPVCVLSPDPAVRAKLRIEYRIEGNAIVLFETRPRWDRPSEWLEEPVAKFRYVAAIDRWRLFCMWRDFKWHGYAPLLEAESLAALVREVRSDPTGIFWG